MENVDRAKRVVRRMGNRYPFQVAKVLAFLDRNESTLHSVENKLASWANISKTIAGYSTGEWTSLWKT